MTGSWTSDEIEERFGRLAHELRIEVLRELWTAEDESLSFSELFDRVDERDSGKFSYHLDRLVPEFVRQADTGYVLTFAGRRTIGAIVSGSFTASNDLEIGSVDAGDCPGCGGTVRLRYEEGKVTLDCRECDDLVARLPVPPVTVAGGDPGDLPKRVSDHFRNQAETLRRGFCRLCHGQVSSTLTAATQYEPVAANPVLDVTFECEECGEMTHLNAGAVLMDHPIVSSFLLDAGIYPHDAYVWELTPVLDPEARLTDESPPRLQIAVELDEEVLELTVDADCTVEQYERQPA